MQELRNENRKLAATIRKYKAFVDDFDAEDNRESKQMTDEQYDGQSQRSARGVKERGVADAAPADKSRGSSRTGAVSRSGRGSTMKHPKTNRQSTVR